MCNGLKTTPAIPNKSPLWNKPPLFRTFFEFQWITVVCYTCGSDDTWDDRVLQEIMQLQPLHKTQINFQYFWPSLLGTDILMVKMQTEHSKCSSGERLDNPWRIPWCREKKIAAGEHQAACAKAGRVFQPGRGGCIPTNTSSRSAPAI